MTQQPVTVRVTITQQDVDALTRTSVEEAINDVLAILVEDVARWGQANHAEWRASTTDAARDLAVYFQTAVEQRRGAVH